MTARCWAGVWADTAYRSKANGAWLAGKDRISYIHRAKTPGRMMAKATAWLTPANRRCTGTSSTSSPISNDRMSLLVRTIGLKRAEAKIAVVSASSQR